MFSHIGRQLRMQTSWTGRSFSLNFIVDHTYKGFFYRNTEPIGYSDTGYSDTLDKVTVLAILKPFVAKNTLLIVTKYCLPWHFLCHIQERGWNEGWAQKIFTKSSICIIILDVMDALKKHLHSIYHVGKVLSLMHSHKQHLLFPKSETIG